MKDKKYIVITDYNLSRIRDLKQIIRVARDKYECESILVRSNPSTIDRLVADHVIDADPRQSDFVERCLGELEPLKDQIQALLPFSDDAVAVGPQLAKRLGLLADDAELAAAAFSKHQQRLAEKKYSQLLGAQGITVPRFEKIKSLDGLKNFASKCERFVLKPCCEGNNRGVLLAERGDDLAAIYSQVSVHGQLGVIAEERIDYPFEASVDGVGSLYFVTEKLSQSEGRFPVEIGQIVGGFFPIDLENRILQAGRMANLITGQRFGPFHNEIKCDPFGGDCAIIEPNRRPGGMRIWDLAEKVYGLNFYELWVDQMICQNLPPRLPKARGQAAIVQLRSPVNLIWRSEFNEKISESLLSGSIGQELELFNYEITAREGQFLPSEPEDNSGFAVQVCFYDPTGKADIRRCVYDLQKSFEINVLEDCLGVPLEEKNENLNIA